MNRAVLPYPAHIDGNGVAVAEGKFLSLPLPLDQMNVSDAFKDRFTNSDDTQPSLASALHGIALDPSPRPGQGSEPACVLPRLRPAASRQALRRIKCGAGNPTCPEAVSRSFVRQGSCPLTGDQAWGSRGIPLSGSPPGLWIDNLLELNTCGKGFGILVHVNLLRTRLHARALTVSVGDPL